MTVHIHPRAAQALPRMIGQAFACAAHATPSHARAIRAAIMTLSRAMARGDARAVVDAARDLDAALCECGPISSVRQSAAA